MTTPYDDQFTQDTSITAAGEHEIGRFPIAPGLTAAGVAQLLIVARGVGSRVLIDEPRVRFVKGAALNVGDVARYEAPLRTGTGLTGATLAIEADGGDLVARVTLPDAVTIEVKVRCTITGIYGGT